MLCGLQSCQGQGLGREAEEAARERLPPPAYLLAASQKTVHLDSGGGPDALLENFQTIGQGSVTTTAMDDNRHVVREEAKQGVEGLSLLRLQLIAGAAHIIETDFAKCHTLGG